MKVLMINGSPREKGCTYTALQEVAKELQSGGIETEIFHIGSKAMQGCTACMKCREGDPRCVFDDGVNEVIDKMESCSGLVVGSPVYFASPNGSLLAFLDRLFYAGKCFAHKPGACVVSARRAGTTSSLEPLMKYFSFAQMPVVSSQYWNMVHGNTPDDVRKDLEGLQTMRTLGKNMAWLIKSIEAGKQNGIAVPETEAKIKTNFIG